MGRKVFHLPPPTNSTLPCLQDVSSQNLGIHQLGSLLCTRSVTASLSTWATLSLTSYTVCFLWPRIYRRGIRWFFLLDPTPPCLVFMTTESSASLLTTIQGQSPPRWTVRCPMAFVMTGSTCWTGLICLNVWNPPLRNSSHFSGSTSSCLTFLLYMSFLFPHLTAYLPTQLLCLFTFYRLPYPLAILGQRYRRRQLATFIMSCSFWSSSTYRSASWPCIAALPLTSSRAFHPSIVLVSRGFSLP